MRTKKIRFLYMLITGIIISLIINLVVPFESPNHVVLYDIICSVIITIIIWEGSLRIDHFLNQKISWVVEPGRRILVQFLFTLIYSGASIYFPMLLFKRFVCELPIQEEEALVTISIVFGILISFVILTVEISTQFFRNWKKSILDVEKYKAETYQAQLQNLKDQVNPHFLFNNLSVLSSLVYKDQDKAVDFINQLSKVYRYVLENKESELVSLEKELNFIKSYLYLLQIRFDKNLLVKLNIEKQEENKFLPPMSLQILIENTIKHNEASEENPLEVYLETAEGYLIVSNKIKLRSSNEPSSNTGLKNIQKRYDYFTGKKVVIVDDGLEFSVKLPLLKKED